MAFSSVSAQALNLGILWKRGAWGRGVFMLQISTLLLREASWMSVKNLGFRAKLSWVENKICLFKKNKQILGYNIQIIQLFSTLL